MAEITTSLEKKSYTPKRAIHFEDGDVLVDESGRIGLRTESHIVRVDEYSKPSLFVWELNASNDLFVKAPLGTSFTVTAQ